MITQKASKDSQELRNGSDDSFPLAKRAKMSAESEETGDKQTITNKLELRPAAKHFRECANVSETKSKMAAEMRFS